MSDIHVTPESYAAEPVRHPPLKVVDLAQEAGGVRDGYRNHVLFQVNDHCLRQSVLDGSYPWHHHPRSDELFLVTEGQLTIELADGTRLTLRPGQAASVPAGTVHRTYSQGRTVTLCLEALAADTVFVDPPGGSEHPA